MACIINSVCNNVIKANMEGGPGLKLFLCLIVGLVNQLSKRDY